MARKPRIRPPVDVLDYVRCWCPLGRGVSVAATGHQRDRGAAGTFEGWAVRLDPPFAPTTRYAVVWVFGGTLHGSRGARPSSTPRDPMIDLDAIEQVVTWTDRQAAIAELKR